VKLHLNRSTRNQHLALVTFHATDIPGDSPDGSDRILEYDFSVVPYSLRRLIENPSFTLSIDPYYRLSDKECFGIVGTCNGLILLKDISSTNAYIEYWLRLWNPTTRTISQKFGYIRDFGNPRDDSSMFPGYYKFTFGYDNSTGTYKVVASRYNPHQRRRNVRILGWKDNVWRDIECFPVIPLHLDNPIPEHYRNVGVYLSGTLNWLAIHNEFHYNFKNITVQQLVIVSLDLETETYNQYSLPHGFDRVPPAEPTVGVLGGLLCFSYSYRDTETYFVIWRMLKFGVEESWTQFLKISYQNLQIDYDFSDGDVYHYQLLPLLLSEDDDTLILKWTKESNPILYNWRDNRVEEIKMTASSTITDNRTWDYDYICWYSAKVYVESLVSIL
jgi:F-box interacting protein